MEVLEFKPRANQFQDVLSLCYISCSTVLGPIAGHSILFFIQDNCGVVVVKTQLYLLVATYTAGMYPSVCVEATEKLGKFASPCLTLFPVCQVF